MDKILLTALKAVFELNEEKQNIDFLLSKISDVALVNSIVNEIKIRNYGKIIMLIDNYLFDNEIDFFVYDTSDSLISDVLLMENANLNDIMNTLGLRDLNFRPLENISSTNSKYHKHWDNNHEFSILIENDLLFRLRKSPSLTLNLTKEIRNTFLGFYTNYNISEYWLTDFDD